MTNPKVAEAYNQYYQLVQGFKAGTVSAAELQQGEADLETAIIANTDATIVQNAHFQSFASNYYMYHYLFH